MVYVGLVLVSALRSRFALVSWYEFSNQANQVLVFGIIVVFLRRLASVIILIKAWLAISLLVALYGICQFMGIDVFTGNAGVYSTFGNANFFSGYLIVVIPLAMMMSFLTKKGESWQVGFMVLTVLLIVCLIFTRTRGAWIAFGVELLMIAGYLIAYTRNDQDVQRFKPIHLMMIGVILLSIIGGIGYRAGGLDRLTEITQPSTYQLQATPQGVANSIQARLLIWQGTLGMIRDAPWFGHGIGTFAVNFPTFRPAALHTGGVGHSTEHAHSEYLELTAELGIIGLLVFLGFLGWCYARALGRLRRHLTDRHGTVLFACLTGMTGLLIHAAFTVDIRYTSGIYLWIMLGMVVVLSLADDTMQSPSVGSISAIQSNMSPHIKLVARGLTLIGIIAGGIMLIPFYLRPACASIHMKKGKIFTDKLQYEAAVTEYHKAIAQLPIYYPAYYHAGHIYAEYLRDFDRAEALYTELDRWAPDYALLHYQLGLVYRQTQRYNDAINEMQRCLRFNPYYRDAHFNLALTYQEAENYPEAEQQYQKVLALAGDDRSLTEAVCNRLQQLYFNQGRYPEALIQSQNLLQITNNSAAALSNIGIVYAAMGDNDNAYKSLKRAIEIDPHFLNGYQNFMVFLRSTGRDAEAKEVERLISKLSGP